MEEDIKGFIELHKGESASALMLRYAGKELPFSLEKAVMQIECRRKCAKKIDFFLKNSDFEFPAGVSAEQASNQYVAQYHSALCGGACSWLDMTAGLGIDAMTAALARTSHDCIPFRNIAAVELDSVKADTLKRNAQTLGIANLNVICADSIEYLRKNDELYDVIFIDPARRDGDNNSKRVYFLEDCLPDVVNNIHLIRTHGEHILIKASPILDLKKAVAQLAGIAELHIVCVRGECKEVLLVIDGKSEEHNPKIIMVDLEAQGEFLPGSEPALASRFTCNLEDLNQNGSIAGLPEILKPCKSSNCDNCDNSDRFLYDPNAALHKVRCGAKLCESFEDMYQLAPDTDLFISKKYHSDFPGRVFRIRRILDKKSLKRLKNKEYNVISRNYPLAAAEIARKYGLKSGQDQFIVACRAGIGNEPILLECER